MTVEIVLLIASIAWGIILTVWAILLLLFK